MDTLLVKQVRLINDHSLQSSELHVIWPTFPTMQCSLWVTSLEVIYQMTCSFLWHSNRLYTTFFHICRSTSQDLSSHLNVENWCSYRWVRSSKTLFGGKTESHTQNVENYFWLTCLISYACVCLTPDIRSRCCLVKRSHDGAVLNTELYSLWLERHFPFLQVDFAPFLCSHPRPLINVSKVYISDGWGGYMKLILAPC